MVKTTIWRIKPNGTREEAAIYVGDLPEYEYVLLYLMHLLNRHDWWNFQGRRDDRIKETKHGLYTFELGGDVYITGAQATNL